MGPSVHASGAWLAGAATIAKRMKRPGVGALSVEWVRQGPGPGIQRWKRLESSAHPRSSVVGRPWGQCSMCSSS